MTKEFYYTKKIIMKIEDSLFEFVRTIIEEETKELKEEVEDLKRKYGEGKTWMDMAEVKEKFDVGIRTQYRKMGTGEYKWKKVNGGKRMIDVRSLWKE